jgi:metacaspase-1
MVQKKALIVGINAYPQSPLQGCVNDAHDYETTLIAKGFTIAILLDSMATKAAIISGLQWLVSGAITGDVLAFCYSGHGTKVPDTNGDEAEGFDEGLCPVDYFVNPAQRTIIDDELKAIFSTVPAGVTLEPFLDSCYSGTATRGLNIKEFTARVLPGPKRGVKATRVLSIIPNLKECAWEACTDTQTSAEGTVGGVKRGLFSYFMCKGIRNMGNMNRTQLMASVATKVQAVIPGQTPVLECNQSEANQQIFT